MAKATLTKKVMIDNIKNNLKASKGFIYVGDLGIVNSRFTSVKASILAYDEKNDRFAFTNGIGGNISWAAHLDTMKNDRVQMLMERSKI